MDGEPIGIRGLFAVDANVAESEEVASRMVENTIDHHLDPALVRFFDQLKEQLVRRGPLPSRGIGRFAAVADDLEITLRIGPEVRINVVEGVAVVFVLRATVKNRVEFERGDAELLQIVEFVDHPLQVTAVATMKNTVLVKAVPDCLFPRVADEVIARPRRHPPSAHVREVHFQRFAGGVVGRIAVAEALRKNLIPNS